MCEVWVNILILKSSASMLINWKVDKANDRFRGKKRANSGIYDRGGL